MNITILYGTETGNAEMLAEDLQGSLSAEHRVTIVNMEDAETSVFAEPEDLFLVVSSTYGDGELPSGAKPLFSRLKAERPDLNGKAIAIFGLGDMQYADTYNFGGKRFEEVLTGLGARLVGTRGMHDASGPELAEDAAMAWLEEILAVVA